MKQITIRIKKTEGVGSGVSPTIAKIQYTTLMDYLNYAYDFIMKNIQKESFIEVKAGLRFYYTLSYKEARDIAYVESMFFEDVIKQWLYKTILPDIETYMKGTY